MLTNEEEYRVIQLKGASGLGKTAIAKYSVKYCLDRNCYKDGAYSIEAGSISSCQGLQSKLFQSMELELDNADEFSELIKYSSVVLLIDECSELIRNDELKLIDFIVKLLNNTQYLKILLVTDDSVNIQFPSIHHHVIHVEPLQKFHAA